MATTSVIDNVATEVIAAGGVRTNARAVWFENYSTTVLMNILPKYPGALAAPTITTAELSVPVAASATVPGRLVITDQYLASLAWYAFQHSGGNVNLNAGRL